MDDLPPSQSQSQSLFTKQFEFVVISSVSLGLEKESEEIDALASRTRRSEQKTSPASQSNVYHDLLQTGHCLPLLVGEPINRDEGAGVPATVEPAVRFLDGFHPSHPTTVHAIRPLIHSIHLFASPSSGSQPPSAPAKWW
ncbi:hypothetical protein ABZX51_008961 [Aspergillus tubingensis]